MRISPGAPFPATSMFKRFPPRWGHIRVPVGSRRGALAGIALYPACARKAVWFQWAAYDWARLFGPRLLPWKSEPWNPPMDDATWSGLTARWRAVVGEFDCFAISERRPVSRAGFMSLLVRGDRPVGFVKVRQNDEGLRREFEALERVADFGPRSFMAPQPMGIGEVEDWSYLVMRPLEAGIHKVPESPFLDDITAEISSSLDSLPRPEGTPSHWRPMHGDFTPWNLRRTRKGNLALVDWEYASWAPPRADVVLYHATLSLIARKKPPLARSPEAVEFWKRRIPERAGHHGKGFSDALLSRIEAQAQRNAAEGASLDPADETVGMRDQ